MHPSLNQQPFRTQMMHIINLHGQTATYDCNGPAFGECNRLASACVVVGSMRVTAALK